MTLTPVDAVTEAVTETVTPTVTVTPITTAASIVGSDDVFVRGDDDEPEEVC